VERGFLRASRVLGFLERGLEGREEVMGVDLTYWLGGRISLWTCSAAPWKVARSTTKARCAACARSATPPWSPSTSPPPSPPASLGMAPSSLRATSGKRAKWQLSLAPGRVLVMGGEPEFELKGYDLFSGVALLAALLSQMIVSDSR